VTQTRFVARRLLAADIVAVVNTHEHFAGVVGKTFSVEHPAARGSVEIPTHTLDELLATKLRAFCQRDKGRDLFDLWWSHKNAELDPDEIVRLFHDYMTRGGGVVESAPELSIPVSLGFIVVVLAVTTVASLRKVKKDPEALRSIGL